MLWLTLLGMADCCNGNPNGQKKMQGLRLWQKKLRYPEIDPGFDSDTLEQEIAPCQVYLFAYMRYNAIQIRATRGLQLAADIANVLTKCIENAMYELGIQTWYQVEAYCFVAYW